MQEALAVGLVCVIIRVCCGFFHADHHIAVVAVQVDTPPYVFQAAQRRCGLQQHYAVGVCADGRIEVEGVQHDFA